MIDRNKKNDLRRRIAAIAYCLGYEPGDAHRPWPGFADDLGRVAPGDSVVASGHLESRTVRHWLQGAHQPSPRAERVAEERLIRLARERGMHYPRGWMRKSAEEILRQTGARPTDFNAAFEKATGSQAELAIRVQPARSADFVRSTAEKYYGAYHMFRFEETSKEVILHGVLIIGPDEPQAPGVPRVALLERHVLYRGVAFPSKHELLFLLRNSDVSEPGCALVFKRQTRSKKVFAGIHAALGFDNRIPAATRSIFVRMNDVSIAADTDDATIMRLRDDIPDEMRPGHPDYGQLAPWLAGDRKRDPLQSGLLGPHALGISGRLVNETLRDFQPTDAPKAQTLPFDLRSSG